MPGFNNMNQMEAPDYSGDFLGVVVFNNDPEKRQRVKVVIPGLLEGAPDLLPWVAPKLDSAFGITGSAGVMRVPAVGSTIVVKFQQGDLSYGLSEGYVHTAKHAPHPELLKNYPNRRGWFDLSGNLYYTDSTGGQQTVHFQHKSGLTIHIDDNGDFTITAPKNTTIQTEGNTTINTNGSTSIATKGSTSVSSKGSCSVTANGDVMVAADGRVQVSGAQIQLN